MKKHLCAGLLVLLCAFCVQATALEVFVPVSNGTVGICTVEQDERTWLFLPSFADLSGLYPDAQETEEDGVWFDEASGLHIMQSGGLRTLFLLSSDPRNQGREWVESAPDHQNIATGTMVMVSPSGEVEFAGSLRQLRGRGNYTWQQQKKGYQIKLEAPADLLKTGREGNRSRTWLLMSETLDGTLLRNKIAQDLALEMGVIASETEFVDLYYDGEYRGVYLLAEKVEVGEGRVNAIDYDELLKKWNNKVGQSDLDALPVAEDVNGYGQCFSYTQGMLDNGDPTVGSYLLEWENKNQEDDRCYFRLEDGSYCGSKSPKNASETMMRYISELFTHARRTVSNGGISPDDGRRLEEVFDLDSLARAVLLHELSSNCDGFTYSSTYFVLPAGSSRFYAGPVWDFDRAFRYRLDIPNEGAAGFKDASGWTTELYSVDVFLETAKRVYLEEIDPLVTEILLGDQQGIYLKSYDAYVEHLAQASRMNGRRWPISRDGRFLYGETREEEIRLLRKFLLERSAWLRQAMSDLQPGQSHLALWLDGRYGDAEESMRLLSAPWQAVEIRALNCEQLTQADEDSYALWQMEAFIEPPDGMQYPTLSINGTLLPYEPREDGTLRICLTFEDPSYRPVDYYGEDIGLVYDYDSYVSRYPEIAQMCGYDPQAVMDYFCDEGMYEGQTGNAYFDPAAALKLNSYLYETLGEDWSLYYWDYIAYGHGEGWMKQSGERFVPRVQDAL